MAKKKIDPFAGMAADIEKFGQNKPETPETTVATPRPVKEQEAAKTSEIEMPAKEEPAAEDAKPEETPATAVEEPKKDEPKAAEKKPTEKKTPKPAKKKEETESEIPTGFLTRHTFYLTYEQSEALKAVSYNEMKGISKLVQEIIDEGLKKRDPDIFNKTKDRAEARKRMDFYKMSETEREKAIKKAAKD